MITIEGTLTEQEYQKYCLVMDQSFIKSSCLYAFLVPILTFGVLLGDMSIVPLMLISLSSCLICLYILVLRTRAHARDQYRSSKQLQHKQRITMDPEGFMVYVAGGHRSWTWEDVHTIKEHKDFFCVSTTNSKRLILPRSFFDDAAHQRAFQEFVREHVEEEKVTFNHFSA